MTPSAAFDVVVLGGGLGGLSTALRLADTGLSVGVLRKKVSCFPESKYNRLAHRSQRLGGNAFENFLR